MIFFIFPGEKYGSVPLLEVEQAFIYSNENKLKLGISFQQIKCKVVQHFCVQICDMERIENKLKLSVCEAIGKKVQKMTGRAKEKEPVKMIEK